MHAGFKFAIGRLNVERKVMGKKATTIQNREIASMVAALTVNGYTDVTC